MNDTATCNLSKSDPMPCVYCGLDNRQTVRATCDDADKAAVGPAKHGPRVTHWACKRCKRCFTVERVVSSAAAKLVGS